MQKSILITGGAARIGAATARLMHAQGYAIVIHYRSSATAAEALVAELNAVRPNSATAIAGDLLDSANIPRIVDAAKAFQGRLDVLINNASSFYRTPFDQVSEDEWRDLVGTNMKAPLFLAQKAAPYLKETQGCIVNLVDVHAQRPKKDFIVYSMAKAANAMMVMALARELGPDIRVNGVSPGVILWPEGELSDADKTAILQRTALERPGDPLDIAKTIRFLIMDANYTTGQIIAVDGGRSVQQ